MFFSINVSYSLDVLEEQAHRSRVISNNYLTIWNDVWYTIHLCFYIGRNNYLLSKNSQEFSVKLPHDVVWLDDIMIYVYHAKNEKSFVEK